MGWSIGYDRDWDRYIGYSVPAVCDHPRCNEKIDRGLAHVCGGEPYGDEQGCGLYFCANHLYFGRSKEANQLCQKCFRYDKKHYKPKPEVKEWIDWMLTDQSWEQWRKENPEKVERMRKSILTPASRDR